MWLAMRISQNNLKYAELNSTQNCIFNCCILQHGDMAYIQQ